jgi:nitrite reductase (NADH) large subunit
MAHLIATYECEWKAAVNDPEKLKQFRQFVNVGEPDRSIVFVSERAQHRPAAWQEKSNLVEEMI